MTNTPDNSTLRVLLAGDTHSPQTARLAVSLVRRGMCVDVINGEYLTARVQNEYGVELTNLAYDEIRLRGNARLSMVNRLETALNHGRLRRQIHSRRYDVIHVNNLYCGERLERLAFLEGLNTPIVATAWGSDVDDTVMKKYPSYLVLRHALLERAEVITACTEPMLRRCRTIVPYREERDFRLIRWLPEANLFNLEAAARGREEWRRRLRISPDDIVVLSPRGTAPNYQIDRIIRAFGDAYGARAASTTEGRRVILIVVHTPQSGDAGLSYVRHLRQLAAPMNDVIRFVEHVPHNEVASLFSIADLAVSIPRADGGPNTHFELMSLGVPLIAADLEDYRGIVTDRQNALLVDATQDETVSQALRTLVEDCSLRRRLQEGGRATMSAYGTFEDSVEAYLHTYRDAIERAAWRRCDAVGLFSGQGYAAASRTVRSMSSLLL